MEHTLEDHIRNVIANFDNPRREGLLNTPERYVKFLKEFLEPKPFKFTTFQNEGYDEMIIVKDIPFYSLCEHHLAPFFGTANVAYIPTNKIVGISKLPRLVDMYARRLQNQERITHQIANTLEHELKPLGVAVSLKAKHLCMAMRGINKEAWTITTKLTGNFREDPKVRSEFMQYV